MIDEEIRVATPVHVSVVGEPMMAYPDGRPCCRRGVISSFSAESHQANILLGLPVVAESDGTKFAFIPRDETDTPQPDTWHLPKHRCNAVVN